VPARANHVLVSDRLEGPFHDPMDGWKHLPDGRRGYIAKVIEGPDGGDVLLATVDSSMLSLPYPVRYGPAGVPQIAPPLGA